MKRLGFGAAIATCLVLLGGGLRVSISREWERTLSQLGLVPLWSVALPRSDPREEVLHAQVLDSDLLVLQMRSGTVLAYDALAGTQRWLVQVGQPFRAYQQPAIASQFLVVIPVDLSLRVLERKSGVRLWQVELNALAHRSPACDDSHLVVLEGENRLRCWLLPHVERHLALLARGPVSGKPDAASRSP
ncbi:MAG: PQQ-binding-like beta-propeller repeat protein, partial [Gemmatales bacterium]|nr:PQQ-like beta-propeller repeat protein [Gemmatales bacterium]MDW8174352.1 PQQ-binding-like beta-propeller repeat protein [Gemmatales bacterium]